jgi:UDP-N-acetyl-D-glucosamine dehydrogenase
MTEMQRLVVMGQGYVGLPLAMRAVEVGFDVVGFDVDESKVDQLAAGRSFVEDISDSVIRAAIATGRFTPTADPSLVKSFDIAVVSVPTPLRDGAPDLSYIEGAARLVAANLQRGGVVVLESTTYPGTTQDLFVPILEEGSGLNAGTDFSVGFSPERIDPGNPLFGLVNTPKVVSGIDDASLVAVRRFYDELVDTTVPTETPREAELAKLLENTFRHVNIALVNELAIFAHEMGINVWDAIDAASTKPFGFMRFEPGPGVGGHCLPIDPAYLSWQVRRSLGETFRFVELAHDVNHTMPGYVVRRVTLGLNDRSLPVRGSRILLLGLAYKRNTGDIRESPSLEVGEQLIALGAQVVAADPHVAPQRAPAGVELVDATADEAKNADAVILLVGHEAFDLDMLVANASYLLDTRRLAAGPNVELL